MAQAGKNTAYVDECYTQRRRVARVFGRSGGEWGLLLPALLAGVVDELVVVEKQPGKRQRLGAGVAGDLGVLVHD